MRDYHPVSHRKAFWFHLALAGVGMVHTLLGPLMVWFHGVSARNHWENREHE